MGLKKKLAILATAGTMCLGIKAQSRTDDYPSDSNQPSVSYHQKGNTNSSKKACIPAIVSGALVGIWAAGGFGKNKKR